MQEPLYKLKIPESQKNEKWYKDVMQYIVPFNNTAVTDYPKMKAAYGLLNNDLTMFKEALDKLCKPLGEAFSVPFEIDEEYAVYNRLYPKAMYLVGQMLQRSEGFDVYLNSDSLNRYKNEEFKEQIEKSIDEWIQLQMEMVDLSNQGATPQQLQDYYKQMRSAPEPQSMVLSDYKSELENFAEKVIDYFKYKFRIKRMQSLSIRHAIATDRCFIGILDQFGIPTPFIFNSLHFGFHKSPNEEKVAKGDYYWYRTAITYNQALNELQDKVTPEELDQLATFVGATKTRPNEGWDIKSGKAEFQHDYTFVEGARQSTDIHEKHVGQSMGTGTNWRYHTARLLWKTYLQFIAYTETIFLTYVNERGKTVTEMVPSNFPIPEQAVKVKFKNRYSMDSMRHEWIDEFGNPVYAEKLWIPRRYEVTRYGSNLYVDYRMCLYQPNSVDNPFDFSLSAKGGFFSSLNAEPISLVERAAPSLMQYILVKNLQNKELAKYEGYIKNIDVRQIPDEILKDEKGEPLYEGVDKLAMWRYYRRKLGDSYFDSESSSTGIPNYQKSVPVRPEVSGAIMEILNMQNLLDLIDREMGLQMLVPPQAEGIYAPYSNATDNQAAINQSAVMSEEFFSKHSEIWQEVVAEYLMQFTAYWRKFFEDNPDVTETFLNYVTSDNTRQTIKITPEILSYEDLGTFVRDSTAGESYRRIMLQQIQALSQNSEAVETISTLIMDITRGESPVVIHKKIVIAAKKQQERMQQIQQMQEEAETRKIELDLSKLDILNKHKLEQIDLTKDRDLEIKALDIFKFSQDKNQDKDGEPDYLEALQLVKDINRKDEEFAFKKQQHADNMKLKSKQILQKREKSGS